MTVALVRRASISLLACVALGAATLAAAAGVIRTGHPGEPDSLDPQIAVAAPALVVDNDLFEGLMTLDARGKPISGAAERYEISKDGLTWRFYLRPGLVWSDGKAITSADFLYSFRRLADPATAATGLSAWIDLIANGRAVLRGEKPVTDLGVAAPSPRVFEVTLAAPTPYFQTIVAFPVFAPMPRHVIEQYGRQWTRPGNMVSNGPFVLEDWRPGQLVRAKRNPNFRDATKVALDAVEYRPVADLNTAFRLFQAGELDAITNFPPEKLEWLRANMPKELRLAPSLGSTVYVFNHRHPKFQDPRVRRALSLAIDRNVITDKIVRSGDRPTDSLVPAALLGRTPKTVTTGRGAALAESRRLLAAAGYVPGRPLEVELLYHTSEEHKNVAVAVAAMWQTVGVKTRLRNAERQVVEVATRNGEFEIVRAAWFSPYEDPMGFFSFLRADSAANASGYKNAAFEAALDRARDARDADVRLRELSQAESIIENDQAVLPLYELVSRRLVARRVQGWRDDNRTALRPARWMSVTGAPSTP